MKKKKPQKPLSKKSSVKEISEGVYINLNRITTDEKEFDKAIEESFKDLEQEESSKNSKRKSTKSSRQNQP
jgi:hypothetical protein